MTTMYAVRRVKVVSCLYCLNQPIIAIGIRDLIIWVGDNCFTHLEQDDISRRSRHPIATEPRHIHVWRFINLGIGRATVEGIPARACVECPRGQFGEHSHDVDNGEFVDHAAP